MTSYFSGFLLGFSFILAIGAQNAFVLKQGLKKQHVFLVCFICAISDAFLISLGVSGFGEIVSRFPTIETVARYGGALFLSIYAVKSFISSFTKTHALNPADEAPESVTKIIMMSLAFTWLNPHVYLDTVVLLGAISTKYEATKLQFGLGAVSASFIFFFVLGYGAKALLPLFQKSISWTILEFMIGFVMLSIALSLILS
ncbi:MAG: L-lysine exporter family protein LysE/ArgO [Oleiphilaceae bacterium]|jgi:L-lysine exporter family protein LysE/ArgO